MPDEDVNTNDNTNKGVDLEKLKQGINPSGLDPDLETKAEAYAKRDWQMNFKPVLERTGLIEDIDAVRQIQEALFQLKYEYHELSKDKANIAKQQKLRWSI